MCYSITPSSLTKSPSKTIQLFTIALVNAFRLVCWVFGTEAPSFMTFVKVRDNFEPPFLVVLSPLWELFFVGYAWKGNKLTLREILRIMCVSFGLERCGYLF